MFIKVADLLPDVELQPHQKRLEDEAKAAPPLRKLLYYGLGSGKSLASIAASETRGPYTAVVPASLRPNYRKEQEKFTDRATPSEVLSYSQLARGRRPLYPDTVVTDESQNLRNPGAQRTMAAKEVARNAKQLLMLSGTPIVNHPSELATPLSMLTGQEMSPEQFNDRFLKEKEVRPGFFQRLRGIHSGTETVVNHPEELKALLKGHVDYYSPDKSVVPVNREDVPVDMGKEQSQLYKAMWNQLPWYLRWKLKHSFPLSKQELSQSLSFLTGPRQVSLSTYPYLKNKNLETAYQQSPKLQAAMAKLQETLKDQRTKALVFSDFIQAGLAPYAAALGRAGVPHAVFHGGLSDNERKKLVDDYNANKIRVALLGPSGTEGLSFKGTQLVQQLGPSWQPVRPQQSLGRALRFDSHTDLPEDLQNVRVQRFSSRLPLGFKDRLLSRLGADRSRNALGADDHLRAIEERKARLNQKFLDVLKEVGARR